MTEAEWLACEDPEAMLRFLDNHFVSDVGTEDPTVWPVGRKLRLFGAACCRRIEYLLTDSRSRAGLVALERYVDGAMKKEPFRKAVAAAGQVTWDYEGHPGTYQAATAVCTAMDDIHDEFTDVGEAATWAAEAVRCEASEEVREGDGHNFRPEEAHQADLLRDIFGNPFRPVAFSPEWRTGTAVTLARQMYESREFGAMPILADALQDAGCDNEEVLSHCRNASATHVRGCWVVDLVLGKS